MKRNFGGLQEELGADLQIASNEPNPITRHIACIRVLESAVIQMKKMVTADPFLTQEEEIHHFKYEAPEVYSQLIYHQKMLKIVSAMRHAGPERSRDRLRRKLEQLERWFEKNETVCRYHDTGASYLDGQLFVQRKEGQWLGDTIGAFIAPDFTIGTYWISRIKANEQLQEWIREELEKPEGGYGCKVAWTGPRIDLLILFDTLWEAGYFEKNQLKDVMEWAGAQLGVKVGQFHSSLNEASNRKEPAALFKKLLAVLKSKFDAMLDNSANH